MTKNCKQVRFTRSNGTRVSFKACGGKGRRAVDPVTPVIFRRYRDDNEIVAVFPTIDGGGGRIMSYVHMGQHGAGRYSAIIDQTRPAKPAEYASLLKELKQIGYDNLKVMQRKPAHSG